MRILVLGASGYVGGVIYTQLSSRHTVVGTCAARPVAGMRTIDLRDADESRGGNLLAGDRHLVVRIPIV